MDEILPRNFSQKIGKVGLTSFPDFWENETASLPQETANALGAWPRDSLVVIDELKVCGKLQAATSQLSS